ncbi:MAG: phenylalanyl-tRNA synthetase alpha chain [Gaiellaceae bacterium]|nr:phenylalanyl-tRNA synthetase alpha chain [Gaiellaceae bacterium]
MDKVANVNPENLQAEALAAVAAAATLEELDAERVRYLGRSSELKLALREVRDRETGMALNAVREALEAAVDARQHELERAELDRTIREDKVDVTMPGRRRERGHLHLVTQVRREVEDIFVGLGYELVDGREIETAHYLFDMLNMAPNHVTRSPLHSFYVGEDTLLRTETSPSQIHTMEAKPPPVYMVSLGRCYRRDTPDATHYPIFHQVEGLAVDRGITLADLKGTLRTLLRQLFGEDREAKFVTHFFPFTEPSVEVLVSCFQCGGEGCPMCRHSGWIEIGGSGMVDPNVLRMVGYDPEEVSGFAFGWGLERMAILRHGLPDIRDLWVDDLRFLEQF